MGATHSQGGLRRRHGPVLVAGDTILDHGAVLKSPLVKVSDLHGADNLLQYQVQDHSDGVWRSVPASGTIALPVGTMKVSLRSVHPGTRRVMETTAPIPVQVSVEDSSSSSSSVDFRVPTSGGAGAYRGMHGAGGAGASRPASTVYFSRR